MSGRPLQPRLLAPVIQLVGFVRTEIADILRQPRLLLILVAGPFIILMLFAAGYDQTSVRLATIFVGPEGSIYETAVDSYSDDVDQYVENLGFTSDVVGAREAVEDGRADLVVVFPPDPIEAVLGGEQAVITVIHDKIDPLQQTAVEISTQVAVGELNSAVLQEIVGRAQDEMVPLQQSVGDSLSLVEDLRTAAAAGDEAGVSVTSADLRNSLSAVSEISRVSTTLLTELQADGADPQQQEQIAQLERSVEQMQLALDDVDVASSEAELRSAADLVDVLSADLAENAELAVTIDPEVAIRPFVADTESLLRTSPKLNEFFAPSAVALLIQHLALTFAALALVRDERIGLLETYRVAPISARHILGGKYFAYLLISAAVAAALVAGVVLGLGVPLLGSLVWVVAGLGLLILASIGMGLVLSAAAGTDTQAVQFAMLVLLASMFFGGFFLSLDAFRFPIRLVSWVLPVTYGIRWLQDVMLRGLEPSTADVVGLTGLTLVYGAIALAAFSRRLAVR